MRVIRGVLTQSLSTLCRRGHGPELWISHREPSKAANIPALPHNQTWRYGSHRLLTGLAHKSVHKSSGQILVPATGSPRSQPQSNPEDENLELEAGLTSENGWSDAAKWESILDDAFLYGIRNKEQLLFEADLGHLDDPGSRITDEPPGRRNIDLWLVLLRAQALQNGHDGIKAIYKGMKLRGKLVRLEGSDTNVAALWKVLLAAGSVDVHFLWKLAGDTQRHKLHRPTIFAEVLGAALEGNTPSRAPEFALFLKPHFRGKEDLLQIFLSACRSDSSEALEAFCRVYDLLPRVDIYEDIIPRLWAEKRSAEAFVMHTFLLSKGDLPPRFDLLLPFISHLVLHNESMDTFLRPLNRAGAQFEAQIRRTWARESSKITGHSPETLNIVASETWGHRPRNFSDAFIARAFATRSISFEFTTNSMRLLGLIEVGPLSVREMVSSAPDIDTALNRFKLLQELEIDTGSSMYVRVLRNTCFAGRWDIVRSLVDNDMHHEAFANERVQLELLTQYYQSKDWRKMNRTLAVLNFGQFNEVADQRATSFLLQSMAKSKEFGDMLNLLADLRMRRKTIVMPREVIRSMSAALRDEIKQPFALRRKNVVDVVTLCVGLLQELAGAGTYIPAKTWRVCLIALGQLNRFDALTRLVFWLAEWYRPNGTHRDYLQRPLKKQDVNPNVLFDTYFQEALISWSFRSTKGVKTVSAEQCLRWAAILKQLRDVYHVPVDEDFIHWIYWRRLRLMFSISPYPFVRSHNRKVRLRNKTNFWHYWHLYKLRWQPRSKSARFENRSILQGLLASARQETRYQSRRQNLMADDAYGPAEIRAAMKVRDELAQDERGRPPGSDEQTAVVYRDFFTPGIEDAAYRR